MDEIFLSHVESLKPKLDQLLQMQPVTALTMPKHMPLKGVYLLSDGDEPLYVGRSNNIRSRIGRHSRPGATHKMASFAFRLARIETGNTKATYKRDDGSRDALMQDATFVAAFNGAKERIREMNLRFVGEDDPVRQALLEIYVAIALGTKHNEFDNH